MTSASQKILVITPHYPFDLYGACSQDRAHGITLLKELGHTVHVASMVHQKHIPHIEDMSKAYGVPITPILYTEDRYTTSARILRTLRRVYPPYWDGAAFEFTDSHTQHRIASLLDTTQPDLVWIDYTYLWPLFPLIKKRNIPIITRSLNFEPDHYYNKVPHTPLNWAKYQAKMHSEKNCIRESNFMLAITPKEEAHYRSLGAHHIDTLPLRRLGTYIGKNKSVHTHSPLNVFFMGSNYFVPHMRQGITFILDEVIPRVTAQFPNTFVFHVFGAKGLSAIQESYTSLPVTFHGYVPDIEPLMDTMDIALVPSLSGEGMQQKIFEPLVRGIPTVTSLRALVGYPLTPGTHVLTVDDQQPQSFVDALGLLRNPDQRNEISKNAIVQAQKLFSTTSLHTIIDNAITCALASHAHT